MVSRNYEKEYREYHSSPLQKKRRAERNAARAKMEKLGRVKPGDKKDIDHKRRNVNGHLDNSLSNLRVQSRHTNRGRNK